MNDREVEAELDRMERAEAEADEALNHLVRAIRGGLLAETFAGLWLKGSDPEHPALVVAVTERLDEAEGLVREAAPRVVAADHTLAALEQLCDEVVAEGERLDAPLAGYGVDVTANRVTIDLFPFDDPAARRLRSLFAGKPIEWDEVRVEPARPS